MLKCHLSIINHTHVTQFDDITLSKHDLIELQVQIYIAFQVPK